jgi:hypothetical protein
MTRDEETTKAIPGLSIGMEILSFIARLPHFLRFTHEPVVALRFKIYGPTPLLEERVRDTADLSVLEILKRAGELRTQWLEMTGTQLAFWDSISTASIIENGADWLIKEAVTHDPKSITKEISLDSLSVQSLKEVVSLLRPENAMALYSGCRLANGSCAHIPMMDFRGTPSESHLARIKKGLLSIGQTRGAILKSGRSYHFYGFNLVSPQQWQVFMGKSLLLSPLTDSRYIAHRLIEGEAALRLTRSTTKPEVPIVIDLL